MHSYAKSMSSSSFSFFVLSRNEVLYLAPLHFFNLIRCWSLKMAKRFTIAYNCKKKEQNKTRNENGYAKKKKTNKKNARNKTRQKKDKLNMNRS